MYLKAYSVEKSVVLSSGIFQFCAVGLVCGGLTFIYHKTFTIPYMLLVFASHDQQSVLCITGGLFS